MTDPYRRPAPQRYRRLHDHLAAATDDTVTMSVDDVADLIDGGLPPSARRGNEWFTNHPARAQARAWLYAGRTVHAAAGTHVVRFARGQRVLPDHATTIKNRALARRHSRSILLTDRQPNDQHLRAGWWSPHLAYIIHAPTLGLYKVGVTKVGSRRLSELEVGRHATLVDQHEEPNRFLATMIECDVLDATEPWRSFADPAAVWGGGHTETWLDSGPTADLARFGHGIHAELNAAREATGSTHRGAAV